MSYMVTSTGVFLGQRYQQLIILFRSNGSLFFFTKPLNPCIYIYIHFSIYTDIYVYTDICIYMCICVYGHICVHRYICMCA